MRRLVAYLSALILATSCGLFCKIPEEHTVDVRDSVYVEKVEYRDTTIYVPIPVESHSTVVADSSHLETSVAESDAWVDTLGRLHHSLTNKRDSLAAHIPVVKTTIYAQATTNSEQVITKIQYVKQKQKWKNWIIAISAILLIFAYRKQIIKLITRWLTH